MLRCIRCNKEINFNNGYLMIWNVVDPKVINGIRFVCSKKCSKNEKYTIIKFEGICDLRLKLKELLLKYKFEDEDEELYVKSLISNIWRNKEIGEEYSKNDLMPPKDKKDWCYVCDKYVDSNKVTIYKDDYDEISEYNCIYCGRKLKTYNSYNEY